MKANELMIGDWVYSTFCDKPCKVVGVEQYESVYANVKVTNVSGVKDINSLTPIPLTCEILEKNGFRVVSESELHVCYFQDIGRFHVDIKVDKVGIFQKLSMCDGFGNTVTIIECRFVHELQHALRLCEIEKEIEL